MAIEYESGERQRLQAALRESEERFRLLFEHSPDAILLCDPHASDIFWPIVSCNQAAGEMNGYQIDELIGRSILLLHPDENAAALRAVFLQELKASGTVRGEAFHRHKDGRRFPIEFSASLITMDGRELVLSIDRDCTERKQIEAALRASQANLRTVLDSLPIEFWMRDREQRVVLQSSLTFLRWETPDTTRLEETSVPLHVRERWKEVNRRAYAGEMVRSEERYLIDGEERTFDEIVVPIPDGPNSGAIAGMRLDITDRVRAEAALQVVNRDLSQRVAELSALHEIALAVMQWTDLPEALQTIGTTLTWLFDRAAISIWIVDRSRANLHRLATIAHDQTTMGGQTLALADDPIAQTVIAGTPAQVLSPPAPLPRVAQPADANEMPRYVSCMLLPLQSRREVIGLLAVSSAAPERTYTAGDMEVAQTISGTLANAIENVRLFEQAQVAAVEEERKRLARDLHDSVSQSLFLANLNAEVLPQLWEQNPEVALQALADLQQFTRSAVAEMRMLLLELRPATLTSTTLTELLQTLATAIGAKHRLAVDAHLHSAPRLPPEVQVALYRITQEAFNNIVKHAQARRVAITLRVSPTLSGSPEQLWRGRIVLVIADDGQGFEPARTRLGRLGISGMRERAVGVGATLRITSKPGAGTSVMVSWSGASEDGREAA